MKKRSIPKGAAHVGKQFQVLYVDGCKVSVKYSGHKNPPVVKKIKDTLIAGGSIKKS